MSRKKISTTIYVTPEQNDRLKLLHERTKVPVAVYIREGIDLVLAHYAHLLPGQLALETVRAQLELTPPPSGGVRRDEDEESVPIAPIDGMRGHDLPIEAAASGTKK
jgi:predicted DNA-binding protein